MTIQFVPITVDDRAMLKTWLSTPDAQEWWGDPDHELRLIYDGEESGESRGYIAHNDDGPFAYIQNWPCAAQPAEVVAKEPWVGRQMPGTLGVDITIGRPDLIGKGLGSATVRAFCAKLFAEGAKRLVIDPDITNQRAVRAYEKAGFACYDTFTNPDGSVTQLMEMHPPPGTPRG